jgi:transcriptional regulator GlxA family with amidase domain
MNVGIYIYNNAEVLDFSGPFEVFSTASRVSHEENLFNTFLVGETGQEVVARGGFKVKPTYSIKNHPSIDVLIIVGGVHTSEMKNKIVLEWIKFQGTQAKLIASVCTGAFLLAQAGLLTNQKVTTHWEDIQDLRISFPDLEIVESKRWVEEGNIVTSAGISAGIDMSLYLVSKLSNQEIAERTALQMEYEWKNRS